MPWDTSDRAASGRVPRAGLAALAAAAVLLAGVAPPSPTDILREADRARGNLAGVAWVVNCDYRDEKGDHAIGYAVQAKGFSFLGEVLAPPKSKGQKLLMAGGNMWFYKPDLSKPVPISQRQKLLGSAAYGDIASTNYAEDYEAAPLPEETLDGEECWVFDLTARTKKATYDRIRYWVSKKRMVGVRGEYFTVSGKKFKSAVMAYDNSVPGAGGRRPFISRMVITDEILREYRTVMTFSHPELRAIPDRVFDLNFLAR